MAFARLFRWLNRRREEDRLNCPYPTCLHHPASPANIALYRRGATFLTCEECKQENLSSLWKSWGEVILPIKKKTEAVQSDWKDHT
jgi:hypothetical protein